MEISSTPIHELSRLYEGLAKTVNDTSVGTVTGCSLI